MTNEKRDAQVPGNQTCGMNGNMPDNMKQMMQQMLDVCGCRPSTGNDAHTSGEETHQQPQETTGDCDCRSMMERMKSGCHGNETN
ncbi:MAG: hypothetical protein HUJ31_15090 [Pseudomonadales bacterium]|nr:hypothetical protein [Pseudomonadales bacterium]